MDVVVLIGYISAILIGVSLGLIGGGGSILAIPILTYLFGISDTNISTTYSLFIVGIASVIGSISYFKKDLVDLRTAFTFGIPAVIAIYISRQVLVPIIPSELFTIDSFTFTKDMAVMMLFAVLMILASVSMIKGRKGIPVISESKSLNYPIILTQGMLVGMLTGFVGAGGGFLIIPALIALFHLPMKKAVGTSLVVISINSILGFTMEIGHREINWIFLLTFTTIAVVGIFIGSALSNKISGAKLKPAFGWFVLIMGIFILGKSILN
tara:strand:- start:684 stop:1487 length:804 start_codon:yes stop_codon:yes gene_type:complete